MSRKISGIESPFISKILNELNELRSEVDKINIRIQTLEGSEKPAEGTKEIDMDQERIKATSTISLIGMARRSIYGYAMLLDSMGISKDQKEMVKQVEASISSMMRLMQTIRAVDLAMKAFEAGSGPLGWAYLAMSGGMFAASMMYGGRSLGGY